MTKNAKAHRHWTLLVVGDNGRVVPIRHAKGWLTFLGIVLSAALMAAVVTAGFYRYAKDQSRRLRSELGEMREQIDNLQHERDLLMARLAVVQAKLKVSSKPARGSASRQDNAVAVAETPAPIQPEIEVPGCPEAPDAGDQPDGKVSTPAGAPTPQVDVEDVRLARDPETDQFRVQFKLINATGEEEPISGHTFVVLKNPAQPGGDWLPLPQVPLQDGRPVAASRGRSFAIARFNTIRFPAGSKKQLSGFGIATVFVYASDGTLLLEKDFPVSIPSD